MGQNELGRPSQFRVNASAERVRVGALALDVLDKPAAIDAIVRLVRDGRGGTVFTPNVDHIVQAEHDATFREAYLRTDLSLVDGTPVLWAARLLGTPGRGVSRPGIRARHPGASLLPAPCSCG